MSITDREALENWNGTLKSETIRLLRDGVFDGVVFHPDILDFVFSPEVEAVVNERRAALLVAPK